jgi:hypothetical protein
VERIDLVGRYMSNGPEEAKSAVRWRRVVQRWGGEGGRSIGSLLVTFLVAVSR